MLGSPVGVTALVVDPVGTADALRGDPDEINRNALIAVAAAPHTNEGSIAVCCGVERQAGRLVELEERMRAVTP